MNQQSIKEESIQTEITSFAEKGLSPYEIATILGLDRKWFVNECAAPDSDSELLYNKGYYKTVATLNAKVIEQAKSGNTASLERAYEILINTFNRKIKNEEEYA